MKKPVKLGAGTAVVCPYNGRRVDAFDAAEEVGAGAGFGVGDCCAGDWGLGDLCLMDWSCEVRMVLRQESVP